MGWCVCKLRTQKAGREKKAGRHGALRPLREGATCEDTLLPNRLAKVRTEQITLRASIREVEHGPDDRR